MNLIDKNELDKLVGEPFEKFLSRLNLKCPKTVKAIPIEWIKEHYGWLTMAGEIIKEWEDESGTNQ